MFEKIVETSLHIFADASEKGYDQRSYLRLVNDKGEIHYSLLVARSRLISKKFLSIKRLELIAGMLSVKMARLIRKELNLGNTAEMFLTDS